MRVVTHGPARPTRREELIWQPIIWRCLVDRARRDPNLRTACRGSHPWSQPRLCVHGRLRRQYILHLFARHDVVANRIRPYGVPCNSICKKQTNLTLQRAYRVNLRRDIEDRRIAGGLLSPPRGTDSVSFQCLDTCYFLARQSHGARKPWIQWLQSRLSTSTKHQTSVKPPPPGNRGFGGMLATIEHVSDIPHVLSQSRLMGPQTHCIELVLK